MAVWADVKVSLLQPIYFFFYITRTSDADDIWLAKLSNAHSHSVACRMLYAVLDVLAKT